MPVYLTARRVASQVPPMAILAFVMVRKVSEVTGKTTARNLGYRLLIRIRMTQAGIVMTKLLLMVI